MSVMSIAMKDMGQLIELANSNLKYLPGPILNVRGFGAVADGTTDVTDIVQSVINQAILEGQKAIFFPHGDTGEYYVTALTNVNQVVLIGDNASFVGGYVGTINQLGSPGGVSQAVFDAFKAETIAGMENIKVGFGAVGDFNTSTLTGTDNTAAINLAIAAAGTLAIPDGNYLYTGTTLTGYYPYIGNGVVYKADGTPHPRFVKDLGSTYALQNMTSYMGFMNHLNSGDDATRVYLIPSSAITTGVGGAIKIFGDPYHLGVDYRDFGIYFSADQGGDNGFNGKGVFWINSKVAGASYTDLNPDIGFSFQDGAVVGGRFVYIKNGFGTYSVFMIGSGDPVLAQLNGTIRAEINGDFAIRNNFEIKLPNADNSFFSYIKKNTAGDIQIGNADSGADIHFRTTGSGGNAVYVNDGVDKVTMSPSYTKFDHAVVHNSTLTLSDTTAVPVITAYNRITFNQPSAVTVTNFTGQNGQRLTLRFANGFTTIQNNANVKLAGAANFVGTTDDILCLECFGTIWYECSRSVN